MLVQVATESNNKPSGDATPPANDENRPANMAQPAIDPETLQSPAAMKALADTSAELAAVGVVVHDAALEPAGPPPPTADPATLRANAERCATLQGC